MTTATLALASLLPPQVVAQAAADAVISPADPRLVQVALVISVLLFVIGLIGFLTRRNMIMMFLCTELMLQAACIAFVTFGRMHMNASGQVFVIFILTVAAAEAALALGLVVLLYRKRETLSSEAWAELKE